MSISEITRELGKEQEARITGRIGSLQRELIDISLDIHAHPEVNYQEHHAARVLTDALERHGFEVERGTGGVETAFRATVRGGGGEGPTIALLAEYDALPGIGHGCGHNLIALTALGAGLGAQAVMDSIPGTLVVVGTPAEEGGGGKIRLLEAGVFDGIDVALSSHPSSNRTVIRADVPLEESLMLAMVGYRFEYTGRAAHAAAVPHQGINALNAVIHLFTGIDALRQHLREDVRIHGIITDGGVAANVVPEFAAAEFMIRSRSRDYLKEVVEKVHAVAEGTAAMTGARLEIKPAYPFYENVRPNSVLASFAKRHAEAMGMPLDEPQRNDLGFASTDFGNVSQRLPAFSMNFAVGAEPIPGHSVLMREAAKSELALENALRVAQVLSLTACGLLVNPELVAAAREEFAAREKASASG